ncbi:cytochrome c [Mucilaginibacter hurinus]|uniref:Cytochrome c n=1 Tax=Mucilaginibacter hurinus TaxID=2201324 RepID=A0A367GPL9_9SPHI|nr:cytochrome c [Mucilaginibacter hurinus]RCH55240.1 cytochrome c [Mucilaginibacter hurinus]
MKKAGIIISLCAAIIVFVASCQTDQQIEYMRYYSGGQGLYTVNCQNCHGKNGEGLSALMPPLTDTAFISKNKDQLACYIKNGMTGMVKVSGKFYNNTMPPIELSPIEIAKVLTYVGNSFGNRVGLISLKDVENNLKNCK